MGKTETIVLSWIKNAPQTIPRLKRNIYWRGDKDVTIETAIKRLIKAGKIRKADVRYSCYDAHVYELVP